MIHQHEPFAKQVPKTINANVFISVGSDEDADAVNHAVSLTKFVKGKKAVDSDVAFKVIESADHGQAFPMTTMKSLYWLADLN